MRRLGLIGILLTAALLALSSAAAVGLGAMLYRSHPVVAGFHACGSKLCWYGILPGETRRDIVDRQLTQMGYEALAETANQVFVEYRPQRAELDCRVLVFFRASQETPTDIVFFCDHIRVGDLMTEIGFPDVVRPLVNIYARSDNYLAAANPNVPPPVCAASLSPFTAVVQLTLQSVLGVPFPNKDEWRGFAPYRHYTPNCNY